MITLVNPFRFAGTSVALVSITVMAEKADKIKLTFNADVSSSTLALGLFRIVINGDDRDVDNATAIGNTVLLEFSGADIVYGDTGTVSYTGDVGGGYYIRDAGGEPAADITSEAIDNQVAGGSSLLTGLVAAWSLNSVLTDESGNGRTLTDGNANLGFASGLVHANAGNFIRANNVYAYHNHNSLHPGVGDYTVETWIKLTNNSGSGDLLTIFASGAGSGGANPGLWLWCRQSDFLVQAQFELEGVQRSITAFPSGFTHSTWVQFVYELDRDGNAQLFYNNVSQGTVNIAGEDSSMLPAYPFTLGRYVGDVHYMNGIIGPCRIWNRLLTALERSTLYNAGAGEAYPF